MSAESAQRYLLPPRPRPADWPLAGACAGTVLGVAEVLVALASGVGLPPLLALVMVGIDALIAFLLAGAIGIGVWTVGARPSHSALVGTLVGVLLWISFSAPLWTAWRAGWPSTGTLLLIGVGSAAIAGIGFGVGRFADRSERAGVPASAPSVWSATALLLAGSARLAYDGPARSTESVAGLVLAGAVLAAGVAAAIDLARRYGSGARIGFGPLLVRLAATAVLAALAPLIANWLLFDREISPIALGPPNILALAIDHSPRDGPMLGSIEYLAGTGDRYDLIPSGDVDPHQWLSSSVGRIPIGASLFASGYATGAIVRTPRFATGTGAADVDTRPGGRTLLEGPASWMSAAPVLVGAGGSLVALLELGDETRPPTRLAADARRWLERWRTARAGSPFFLLVDFRGAPASDEALDESIGALLATIDQIEAGPRTLVIALLDPPSAGEPLHVVLRAPPIWGETGHPTPRRLGRGELGDLLLDVATRRVTEGSADRAGASLAAPGALPSS